MLSEETMQKYQELNKLLQEVKSPILEKMRKMQQEAMQKISPDELRKQMEQAKFDEERFKQMLEKTIEMMKRIQIEQKIDALIKRGEELKRKQDNITKQMNQTNDKNQLNELPKKQDQLKDELKQLSNDLKDLESQMKELGENEMPLQEMKEARDILDKNQIAEDMEKSSNSMKSDDKKNASKSQKSCSNKLQKFNEKMQQMKKEMQENNSKEVAKKLQKTIENLGNVSKTQEKLKNQTKQLDANSTQVSELAKTQATIFEDIYNVGMDLMELGKKSFAITQEMADNINSAMRNMKDAMNDITERNMQFSANKQTAAIKKSNLQFFM